MKKLIALLITVWAFNTAKAQDYTGSWLGSIAVSGIDLRLAFNIKKTSDTSYSATLDSPDQKAFGIPATRAYVNRDTIFITLASAGIQFKGTLTGNDGLYGMFKQGGSAFPLEMRRITADEKSSLAKDPVRPQTPKKPYGYYSEDVIYTNSADSTQHYGATFTRPNGNGKYPAVIIISGSGTQDRDGTLFGHKLYWVLADYLTKNGIAVLRVDDRGAGKSSLGKNFRNATSLDFSYDVENSLNYLETRADVDKRHIGLIGHSEGGVIAPMVAARRRDVSFLVLWGAPEAGGLETGIYQNFNGLRRLGIDSVAAIAFTKLHREELSLFAGSATGQDLDARIIPVFERWKADQTPQTLKQLKVSGNMILDDNVLHIYHKIYDVPWWRFFITYNPVTDLAKVKCPVLAVNGKLDTQVDARTNLALITSVLTRNGNRDFETVAIPALNHLLQPSLTGDFSEYAKIDTTMSPVAMDIICRWIKLRVK